MNNRELNHAGLTDLQVKENRFRFGANVLEVAGSKGLLKTIAGVLKEPMIILLAIACSIYFITGETGDGIIMLVAIFFVTGISIYQEAKSDSAVKALRKLTQPLTTVVRNGEKEHILSEEVVVGDIMFIEEGKSISADAKILESNDLMTDESILTGESFPVEKVPGKDEVYMGANVVAGSGYTEVTAVGLKTRIGKLGKSLEEIKREESLLQKQINVFVKRMAIVGFTAFAFVWIYNYYKSGDLIHGLMQGLTLAMSVLPEEIPVAVSTFMALGAYHLLQYNIITKQPQTVEALGSATVICVDKTGTLTENKMNVSEIFDQSLKKVFNVSDISISEESVKEIINYSKLSSEPEAFDPMEIAIEELFDRLGDKTLYKSIEMIKEYPLSGKPPMMTHVYSDGNKTYVSGKGAPERIMSISDINEEERRKLNSVIDEFASKGLRVLGVAKAEFQSKDFPEDQNKFKWKFLGLIGFSDPPKKNIADVIKDFYRSGIEVKMITGDFLVTAKSISKQIGIKNPENVLTGEEIVKMNETELRESVKFLNVFARMLPEAKLKIVNALKSNGEVVAMTGDGVNDGPALKTSNIGIAMGRKGSEIARQEASLIITDDDLSNMVKAVALGRKIYANLKKAIRYIISIHIPIISVVTIPLLLGMEYQNVFMPVHVIFLELIMGPTCSIVFENEPVERNILDQKPRRLTANLFSFRELTVSIVQGFVIAAGLMGILYFAIESSLSEDTARSMVFSSLLISNIFLTYTGRSDKFSVFETIKYKNNLIYLVTMISVVLLIVILTFQPAMDLFGFDPLNAGQILICGIVSFVSVVWIEAYKQLAVNS